MADQKSALKAIVVKFHDVLTAVSDRLGDTEAKKEILRALGLDPAGANKALAIPADSLASIQQFIGKSDDDIDIEAFASVLADTLSVAQAVKSFVDLVAHAEDPDAIDDFLDILVQLFVMDAVRLRSGKGSAKALYQVMQSIGMYDELAAPSGGVIGFTKNIAAFSKRLFGSFDAKDSAEAAMTMDAVFIILEAASIIASLKWPEVRVRDHLTAAYGFDAPRGSTSPNADVISDRTLTAQLSYKKELADGSEAEADLLLSFTVRPKNEQGFSVEVLLGGGGTYETTLGAWKFTFSVEGVPEVDLRAKIGVEHDGDLPTFALGETKGTNLTIGAPSLEVTASVADQDLDIKATMENGGFVLKKGEHDGFLDSLMPAKPIFGAFDLAVGYSLKKQFYVDGGSGLTVLIPLHAGPDALKLTSFYLKLGANKDGDGILVETSIGLSSKFFGFAASIERVGLVHNLALPANGERNLGFIDYHVAGKPPTGVGLSLDAGAFKGGGFLYFDADKGEYFGAVELLFKESITIKAIGIINTKMPDGSKGFSMLLIVSVENCPPLALPLGFFITGWGGLIGLHRTARIDVLREGIKTNALKSILFPEDVVANMSRIISDLRQVFPPLKGRTLLALMVQIQWGTGSLATLELGLLLEFPLHWKFTLLGVLKVLVPEKGPALLRLQVNFLGVLDFENKFISFDATLYDSMLQGYVLTGDMALRVNWSKNSMFLLSAGGFHPAYKEAPGDLQNMTRLTISLMSGENPRISAQSYFAVTSNTVQHGAKVELYAAASGFNIYGFVSYDVLFHFKPFSFVASLAGGVALRRGSNVIMGIHVSADFSGPTPWDVKGKASVSILFFDVTVPFHETWGDPVTALIEETVDLMQALMLELDDNRNWRGDPPQFSNLHVSVKKMNAAVGNVVVHPFGVLTFSQRLIPLDVTVEKFGLKKPKDADHFTIAPTDGTLDFEAATELFAPANFFQLKDSEKLARPSFEILASGFMITSYSALQVPMVVSKSVDYELTYVRKTRGLRQPAGVYKLSKDLFKMSARGGSLGKSSLSFGNKRPSLNAPEEVKVASEAFDIVTTADMKSVAKDGAAGSYTEASQRMKALLAKDPSLAGQVQIVSTYELQVA